MMSHSPVNQPLLLVVEVQSTRRAFVMEVPHMVVVLLFHVKSNRGLAHGADGSPNFDRRV